MPRGDDPAKPGASGSNADRKQDPLVERRRPDPARPPRPALELTGFLGDSDRDGFRRLYFTRDLDSYAEFRVEDVVQIDEIPAEVDPFRGEQASRVAISIDATVDYTRSRPARAADEFDLDVRLPRRGRPSADRGGEYTVGGDYTQCEYYTCASSYATVCGTCETQCGTCQTQCGACLIPYTVQDPTCAATCFNPGHHGSCDTGCQPLWPPEHGPSDIQTACLPACPDPQRRRGFLGPFGFFTPYM